MNNPGSATASLQSEILTREDSHWSDSHYRKIFDHSEHSLIVFDAQEHSILDLNNRLAAMFGFTKNELLHRSLFDLWPDHSSDIVDLVQPIVDGTQQNGMAMACSTKDGNPIRIELSASFIVFNNMPSILCIVSKNGHSNSDEKA